MILTCSHWFSITVISHGVRCVVIRIILKMDKIFALEECSDTIIVYETKTGSVLTHLKGSGSTLVYSPPHKKITVACDDGLKTIIYDVNTVVCLVTLDGVTPIYDSHDLLATTNGDHIFCMRL